MNLLSSPISLSFLLARCLLLLSVMTSLACANDVAVWGWRAKGWQQFLREKCDIDSDLLKSDDDQRLPIESFDDYRLVIIGQGKPGPLSKDDHRKIHAYMEKGGVLLVNTISISQLGRTVDDSSRDFPAGEQWIGGGRYSYGTIAATVLEPQNPAVAHLTQAHYPWFDAQPGITNLTSGRVLIGVEQNARVLVHRVGKGGLVYISPEVIGIMEDEKLAGGETDALLTMVSTFVNAATKGEPKLEAVLGEPVRGALIEHGGTQHELVIVTTDEDRKVAAELAALIGQSQGKQVKVVTENEDDSLFEIHVGKTPYVQTLDLDFKTLHPYGYYITLSDPRHLVLTGKDASASSYAVYDFLKRYNGYRFFASGPLGTVLPQQTALKLPEKLDHREEPSLPSFTNAGAYKGNGSFSRSWRTTLYATHILGSIVPSAKYGKTHPDYFPMYDGERFIPGEKMHGTWQPCVSHPDLPRLAIEWAEDYLKKNPHALGFPLGVNDGGGDCRCPDCLKAREQYGNQYIPFYNAVAKLAKEKFPGKYVAFIAYGGASKPPTGIQLEDNLLVEVVSGLADQYQPIKDWQAAGAKHFGLYDYLYGAGYITPRHYPKLMGQAWKEAGRDYGLISVWIETFTQSWYYDGPRLYVLNELAWNINADVDALLDDYFTKFYGPASTAMRSFFDRLEVIYRRKADPLHPMEDRKRPAQLAEFTAEDLSYLRGQLEAARRDVGEGIHRQRLACFEALWKLTELYTEVNIIVNTLETLPAQDPSWPRLLSDAYEKMQAISDYQIPEEQQKEIFSTGDLAKYKGMETMRMRPTLELAADRLFARIDAHLASGGAEAVLPYWKKALAEGPREEIRLLLASHIAEHENQPLPNLFAEAAAVGADELVESDWDRADARFPGWHTWTFPRSITQFAVTSENTPNGQYAMGIRQNDIAGSFLRHWRVEADERYRVTLMVKQDVGDVPGRLSIRWKNESNFLPENSEGSHAPVSVAFPKPTGQWQKLSIAFTVPKEATTGVFLLAGPKQSAEHAIWFSDVSLFRTYPDDHSSISTQPSPSPAMNTPVAAPAHPKPLATSALLSKGDTFTITPAPSAPELQRAVSVVSDALKQLGLVAAPEGRWHIDLKQQKQLSPGGYDLSFDADTARWLVEAGDEEGSRTGLMRVLHHLGVRWFDPSAPLSLPVLPREVSSFHEQHTSSFPYRGLHICAGKHHYDEKLADWMSFQQMNRKLTHVGELPIVGEALVSRGLAPDTTVHSYSDWISDAGYFETNPEFFSLLGGKRVRHKEGGQLCLSNATMRRTFIANLRSFMADHPEIAVLGICPNDGYGWCECDGCRALDSDQDKKAGAVNRRVARFVEEVCSEMKESHPQLLIGHYSYSNFSDFHLHLKEPPSNLMVSCTTFRCYRHAINHTECPTNGPLWERMKGLRSHLEHVYVYDYLFHNWKGLPQPIWSVIEADLAAYEQLGIRGYLTEAPAPTAGNYGSAHLALYVMAQLLYDRSQTASALLDDYCAQRYGVAAKPMRRYFDTLAKGVETMEGCLRRSGDSFERLLAPEVIAQARGHLAEAAKATETAKTAGGPALEALLEEQTRFDGWIALREARSDNQRLAVITPEPLAEGVFQASAPQKTERSLLFLDQTLKVPPASSRTWANAYADKENVAFIIECEEEAMQNAKDRPGLSASDVYGSESVEIFLQDGSNPELCYHILISISGGHAASECIGTRWNWSWKGDYIANVERKDDRWRVFFSIPREKIGLKDQDQCKFTLVRNRRNASSTTSGVPDGGVFFKTEEYLAMNLP